MRVTASADPPGARVWQAPPETVTLLAPPPLVDLLIAADLHATGDRAGFNIVEAAMRDGDVPADPPGATVSHPPLDTVTLLAMPPLSTS